jgi:diguanylate cyclase (GGDEF)-like protein
MGEKTRVLLVDDDIALLKLFKEALEVEGYICETASEGKSALDLLKEGSFHFLITDVIMPGMKGFELTQKVKEIDPNIAIIIMTGFVDDFSFDRALESGASDFIKKPFTASELIMRMKHVEMQENLRIMSITDELTGLFNRRGFFPIAEQQLKLADRSGTSLILMFADIDKMKWINDKFGHKEGDAVLIDVSRAIKESFRDSDIFARLGGDEFAVLMVAGPDFDKEIVRGRLSKNVEAANKKRSGRYTATLSIGFVVFDPAHPCSLDELLSKADTDMYKQKNANKSARPDSITSN